MPDILFEPGSFRDRTSRIFYSCGSVYRALTQQALQEWETFSTTQFYRRLSAEGKIIRGERKDDALSLDLAREWAAVLKHPTLPFISYPYEWPFSMLRDAALLQLELLLAALDEGLTMKDATPFNFQWLGTQPLFIDLPSFERFTPGEPWVGYRQFCQLFLYPLLLQAYKDIPFQPWLRGSLDGIEPEQCQRLMSLRDFLRPGVLSHVYLQAKAQSQYAATARNVKAELREAGFDAALIQANVKRLQKLVRKLSWRRATSTWSDYTEQTSYNTEDEQRKKAFVRQVAQAESRELVWDLGCNTGVFSRIAAENARTVVAMDADHLVVERLYHSLKAEEQTTILPLVSNLADPSPNLGWRGCERKTLPERGKPDLTLCLALIHHIVITANVPLKEFVDWLANLTQELVIEFVTRNDPMVRTLLRNKRDIYADYHQEYFERCLKEAFTVIRQESLASGARLLYYGRTKRTSAAS